MKLGTNAVGLRDQLLKAAPEQSISPPGPSLRHSLLCGMLGVVVDDVAAGVAHIGVVRRTDSVHFPSASASGGECR